MSLQNLFFTDCFEPLTIQQRYAVEDVIGASNIADKSCSRADLNTCGIDISELIESYDFFSAQKGLYKSWGDISFPWEISQGTPGLLFEGTTDKWSAAAYKPSVAYPLGSRVLMIEDDGYLITLYEANTDILSSYVRFVPSQWDKICSIVSVTPAGVQSEAELRTLYQPYGLKYSFLSWEEAASSWNSDLRQKALDSCSGVSGDARDICLKNLSDDRWGSFSIRKENFYDEGDIVLVDGECGDSLCVWTAIKDVPVTDEVYKEYEKFKQGEYWVKNYCISTGSNKCLEYQRKKTPQDAYEVIEIGSKGHYVEKPIPFSPKYDRALLNDMARPKVPLKTLSDEEISTITPPS